MLSAVPNLMRELGRQKCPVGVSETVAADGDSVLDGEVHGVTLLRFLKPLLVVLDRFGVFLFGERRVSCLLEGLQRNFSARASSPVRDSLPSIWLWACS